MKLEIGSVLVRRGAHAPFIVNHIWYITDDHEVFEITDRSNIDKHGCLKLCERVIRSRSLSLYDFISVKFMDEAYVKWATQERGGLFIKRVPQPLPAPPEPEKPSNKQIDIVKAVFYRQNRLLNPGITVEEVERLWNENYFPLYAQICFELREAVNKAGSLTPLNYDPPNPPNPAPSSYRESVHKARLFEVPVPVVVDKRFGIAQPVLSMVENLLDKHGIQGAQRKSRIEDFRDILESLLEGDEGDCLTEDELKHVVGSSSSRNHILAIQKQEVEFLIVLGDLSNQLIPILKVSKSGDGTDVTQAHILDSGHSVSFGEHKISCSDIISLLPQITGSRP